MNEAASAVVIELAKEFIELVRSLEPSWARAYYRFRSTGSRYGSNASYLSGSDVSLIGAIKNAPFYESMNKKGASLLNLLTKEQGVFLLSVDSHLDYDIKFEWNDLDRWEITKMNGRSGIPEGI